MRSSTNQYLAKVDHLRALAVFQVFIFHFVHNAVRCRSVCGDTVYDAPFPPTVLFEQGYSGVALFMCLSGYIFSYLTDGHMVHPLAFFWNRFLRLIPLIVFWRAIIYLFYSFSPETGTWSVIVELEFYAILPVLIIYLRGYGEKTLLVLLFVLIAYRWEEWYRTGNVLELSYYTIVGRGDQILLGMLAFYVEKKIRNTAANPRRVFAIMGGAGLAGLCAFYYYFGLNGGLYRYPSTGVMWAFMPTIDGICYCCIALYYLQLTMPPKIDAALSALGSWSYSIYLNHFLLVPPIFVLIATKAQMPENFYARFLIATILVFPVVAAFSAVTYRFVEKPFLRFRKSYLMPLHSPK